MPASRSTDPAGGAPGPGRAVLSLGRYERLAALGALICLASFALPWYRLRYASRFSETGFGSFGFAEAALALTVGAALVLLVQVGRGRRPPLPLHEGTLLAAAGIWSALIVAFLMIDRPSTTITSFPADYGLSYGIFFAMGGAGTIAVAGLRIRRSELAREAAAGLTRAEVEARSPTSASPPRSPR